MSNKAISVYATAQKRNEKETTLKSASKFTSPSDLSRDNSSNISLDKSRDIPLDLSRGLPSRNEIQEFTFQLRDEVKVKIQAEVPHGWQEEFKQVALELDVKKLELYRFILGEFLGKVKRKNSQK